MFDHSLYFRFWIVNLFDIIILIYYSSVSYGMIASLSFSLLFIRFLGNLSYLFVSRSIVVKSEY